MKEVSIKLLKETANSLMFDMSEEEYALLKGEFDTIQKQMSLISNLKGLDEVSPMTFPYDVEFTYLREDTPKEVESPEDALKNAKDVIENQIRIPKVIK
ncbi:MAG: Asp-tRNA(Asn)/Glu-tRNA(Gln) amidotransferase GatCAB subunit C [Coprobacillus sp.]|nr:Asp-tRNA(Asn)/Glu-tRNA(Gln) amidotransferase GatCAB subunit C [Coprobacillus sp.]